MGEVDAKGGGVTRQDLGYDWYTVSLLMDHHSLKYRGKVLEREVAEAVGEVVKEFLKFL
jgi:hypothetical protein